jgi:hypothetical protein
MPSEWGATPNRVDPRRNGSLAGMESVGGAKALSAFEGADVWPLSQLRFDGSVRGFFWLVASDSYKRVRGAAALGRPDTTRLFN